MNVTATGQTPTTLSPHEAPLTTMWGRARRAVGLFWQRVMMWLVRYCPWLMSALTPPVVWGTWQTSSYLRRNLLVSARAILGPRSTLREQTLLGRRTLRNFFEFIIDLGRIQGLSPQELVARVSEVEGREQYHHARASRRGAILVSAHLGSFEVGLAALCDHEKRIHVVFQRDLERGGFERLRTAHRERLGIIEAPIDDGLPMWLALRDALSRDEVVLMLGDRVMPGQKGQRMEFLGRRAMLPSGPVRLALASGAPIVPIFAPRDSDGRIRILLEKPIFVDPNAALIDGVHPAMLDLAATIERTIRRYPDQWLMVHWPWCEGELP